MLTHSSGGLALPCDLIIRDSCGLIGVVRLYASDLSVAWEAARACKRADQKIIGLVCAAGE